jgi:hypothetical protein
MLDMLIKLKDKLSPLLAWPLIIFYFIAFLAEPRPRDVLVG